MSWRPAIGTTLWSVHEHLYYIPEKAAPVTEYCVCESKVRNYIEGNFTQICSVGKDPDGYGALHYFKLSDLGKNVFFNPKEAAELAKRVTEKYEQTWGWMGDPPLRRTWEKYLKEDDTNESKT